MTSGKHKTFLKASRWVYSRAATGAGCARCPLTTRHTAKTQRGDSCGNECRTHSREPRRLSLSFGGSAPRRPKRTQPDLGKTQLEQLRDDRNRTQIDHLTRMTTETRRSRADVAGSRAVQSLTKGAERRLRTDLRGTDSNDEAVPDHTWHGGIHDHADDKVANRALGSLTSTHSAWRERSLPQSGAGDSQTTSST